MCDELRRDIKHELKDFRDSFERDLRKELREIRTAMSFINQSYEEMKTQLNTVLAENKEIRSTNSKLAEACDAMSNKLKAHESRIMHCEQYSRNANIEVKGIPTHENESLVAILKKVGEEIGEPITAADVEIAHRVPVPNNPSTKNIVVQFVRRTKRNEVLEKARKHRLHCRDLGFDNMTPVYINEHLCPEMKKLLGQATAKRKETGWKYLWVRNGQVLARRAEDTPVLKITCGDDLSKMSKV